MRSDQIFGIPPLLLFWAALITISIYRLAVLLSHLDLSLYSDEAYYWGWAQALDWGYFSKPPMIAAIIATTTALFGDSELAIKAGSLIIYPFTAFFIFLIGRRLFGATAGLVAGLIFFTLPAISMSSLVISTDVPLLLFWSAALFFLLRALEQDRWRDWLLVGLASGLGLLSKYTMGIFALSALLLFLLEPAHRHQLRRLKPYAGAALAFLIFLPNLLWNAANDFISFRHTAEISHLDRELWHPDQLLEFFFGQFLVFGPLLMALFLYRLGGPSGWIKDPALRVTALFALPFLGIICLQALLARAQLNWAAPTYVAATLFIVGALSQRRQWRWLIAALAINLLLALAIYHYHPLMRGLGIELTRSNDFYGRVTGWRELGQAVSERLAAHPDATLLCDDRNVMAELIYYVRPHPFDARMWNPRPAIKDHYKFTADVEDHGGDEASAARLDHAYLLVTKRHTEASLAPYFGSVETLPEIRIPFYRRWSMHYRLYRVAEFRGYESGAD